MKVNRILKSTWEAEKKKKKKKDRTQKTIPSPFFIYSISLSRSAVSSGSTRPFQPSIHTGVSWCCYYFVTFWLQTREKLTAFIVQYDPLRAVLNSWHLPLSNCPSLPPHTALSLLPFICISFPLSFIKRVFIPPHSITLHMSLCIEAARGISFRSKWASNNLLSSSNDQVPCRFLGRCPPCKSACGDRLCFSFLMFPSSASL